MITWMQKHKKWLVVTIWISTIAFVGAGFVGWGSYEYGKSSGSVAVVGDRKISFDEYQREYSNLYQQYSQVFGQQFNQEMAKQLNLSKAAYDLVIQKNLIMSFGDELGLDVTNEDVAKELVQMPPFIKDGKFDKATYLNLLAQNGTNAQDFENTIRRAVLLEKVEKLFEFNTHANEVKNLNQLLFSEDKIAIKILNQDNINVKIDPVKLEEYWQTNKNKYMSGNSYELEISKYPVTSISHSDEDIKRHYEKFRNDFKKEDGKIKSLTEAMEDIQLSLNKKAAKKAALKKYLKLKKGEEKFDSMKIMAEEELTFDASDIAKIKTATPGTVIKPFLSKNEYITIKLVSMIMPKPLSFEKAKPSVLVDFTTELKNAELFTQVKKELENFKGKEIGYVNRTSIDKISGLQPAEAQEFLTQLFTSTVKKGEIRVGKKVVLFEILESRLSTYDETKNEAVKTTLKQLQDSELKLNLVKRLENKYEIQTSENEEKEK